MTHSAAQISAAPTADAGAFTRRVASQGALLFSGFAVAQICSFIRNAIIGHMLAKGDFGIAATLTLVLQLIENMTDVGADRLVVQAPGGDAPRFAATAHTILIGRGVLTALVLYLASGPFCRFLDIAEAQQAFELIALVPFIKGFVHLDVRVAQRELNNWPQALTETVPQLAALALIVPALIAVPSYAAVAGVSLAQALAYVVASHTVAKRPYLLATDVPVLRQLLAFGWPIWLSAFPLFAVYQGDRLIIGKLYGMEALAGYSVAFLVTMVPALVAAKVGHALMLPLLSSQRENARAFANRYASLSSVTALAAALYFVVFGTAGGAIVPLAFGANYVGLGSLTAWLALMWTLRMVQVVPGMAVMANGETRPFLVAGLIRALALPPALLLALHNHSVETLAAAGVCGELASLLYIVWRAGKLNPALPAISSAATSWLAGVAAVVVSSALMLEGAGKAGHMAAAILLAACVTGYALIAQSRLSDGLAALMPRPRASA